MKRVSDKPEKKEKAVCLRENKGISVYLDGVCPYGALTQKVSCYEQNGTNIAKFWMVSP